MKVLIVGSGGREHSIIRSIKKSKKISKIFAIKGNGGIGKDAINIDIDELDNREIVKFAKIQKIDFVIVSPDNPLANGLIDSLLNEKIACFGPTKSAAKIEYSKIFAKNLMKKYDIPTAKFRVFSNSKEAVEFIRQKNEFPIVIKADGLAYGKGVLIAKNLKEALDAVDLLMVKKKFKESGDNIVIEEFLTGTEVSVLCFTDGKVIKPMPAAMDHKAVFDDDKGPNTGGMGAIARNPVFDQNIEKICMNEIFIPTVEALKREGCPFKGCLYFGLMVTKDGPKVIEYNCRFGDPEAEAILPLLETDLLTILKATYEEKLEKIDVKFSNKFCAAVVVAAPRYPEKNYIKNIKIEGLTEFGQLNSNFATIYHCGTKFENGAFYSTGGRILCVSSIGETLKSAIACAYMAISELKIDGAHYRLDIGKTALKFEI